MHRISSNCIRALLDYVVYAVYELI